MSLRKWIKIGAGLLGLSAMLVVGYYYNLQDEFVFMYKPLEKDHKFSFNIPFEEIEFQTDDGSYIHSVLFRAPKSKGVVVYYHGQGVNIATKGPFVSKNFTKRGYDVLMMDYRGFGKSRGVLTEKTLFDDALLPYHHIAPQYDNVVVYGCSLGTGVATYVASKTKPTCLILESPFNNLAELGQFTKPFFPLWLVKLILRYEMKSDEFIQSVTSPVHIFHGTSDKIIPIQCSLKLAELCKGRIPIDLTTVICGTHNHIAKHPDYHEKMDVILGAVGMNPPVN